MTETLNLNISSSPAEGYRLNVADSATSTSTRAETVNEPPTVPPEEATDGTEEAVELNPSTELLEPPVNLPSEQLIATRKAEDLPRIKAEAKEFFDHFEDPQDIKDLRQDLGTYLMDVTSEMTKQFTELGLLPGPDGDQATRRRALEKIDQAVEAARTAKIAELSQSALPYETNKRKERKQIDSERQKLAELLAMPAEEFGQLEKDWELYKIDELHAEALKEDKNYKVGEQRRAARGEISALDQKYDGVLGEISRLPLDKEPGGQTHDILDSYLQRQRRIKEIDNPLANREMLQAASLSQALSELQTGLRQRYQAEGLSAEQIQAKLDQATPSLETWLEHINGEGIPLADLARYENRTNKENALSQRRQKASEYIGSVLLIRTIRGVFERGKNVEKQTTIDIGEILERGIDHNSSRLRTGAEALSDPNKAGSLGGRIMAQLEMARNLSRNEGTLMRSLIYMTAVEKSLGDSFITAWDAIPEERKRQARKKLMLGMAAAPGTIARLSARLRAKARKTAATGAAAGTIWLGNRLGRG